MSTTRCMNAGCMVQAVGGVWKKGWLLKSGGFAMLCEKCGLAYEQLIFCDIFHPKESGWRECAFCNKRLHCGCIASKSMLDLLDAGGVQCLCCLNNYESSFILGEPSQHLLPQSSQQAFALSGNFSIDEKMNEFGISLGDEFFELHTASYGRILNDGTTAKCNLMQFGGAIVVNGCSNVLVTQRENTNESFEHVKKEQVALSLGELGHKDCSVQDQGQPWVSQTSCQSDSKDTSKENSSNPLAESCLSMSLSSPNMSNILEACSKSCARQVGVICEARDQKKALTAFQQFEKARHVMSKPPKTIHGTSYDAAKEVVPQIRVARPPVDGKGRNQLLPRYWPRITDQELQLISGDSKSTIVPLFEKVLSVSDAGRIGRLVLPKACAEAYFPPIFQPEGLPLKIQDTTGKEWHFQFRFWPNNNSRMYVLEGVTPCIQYLQLQAGDIVTFSQINPEGKLVMGFRKATNTVPLQDSQILAMANGTLGTETFYSEVNENLSVVGGYSGIFQSLKETEDLQVSHFPKTLNCDDGDASCIKTNKLGNWENEGLLPPLLVPEKRRTCNIGSKSKRLRMDNEDAMELKLTWEEAQDLLRPPPRTKPSIVIIEDLEFEEYEEPPVLGKRSFFTARTSGGQDQWIQCDDCFKWRWIPVEVLPPSKWTCVGNLWDSKRSSCAEPDEMTSRELQALLQQHAEIKKRRIAGSKSASPIVEPTGLDSSASAAVLEEVCDQATTSSVAATTRHPRHRPGCSCIVCIQPPSGKGPKHNPACTCNVCLTVKRRFKTLMLRKKKRRSELEELEGISSSLNSQKENEIMENHEISKGHRDLNFQPQRDAEQRAVGLSSSPQISMLSLFQEASFPRDNYLMQSKLVSLVANEHSSAAVPQAQIESESGGDDEHCCSDKVISDGGSA